jgi:hypothetical protein
MEKRTNTFYKESIMISLSEVVEITEEGGGLKLDVEFRF